MRLVASCSRILSSDFVFGPLPKPSGHRKTRLVLYLDIFTCYHKPVVACVNLH